MRRRRSRRALRSGRGRERIDFAGDGRCPAAVRDRRRGSAGAGEHRVLRGARPAVLRAGRLPVPCDDRSGARGPRGSTGRAGGARRAGRARRAVVRGRARGGRCARSGVLRRGRCRRSGCGRPGARQARAGARSRAAGGNPGRRPPRRGRHARDRLRALVGSAGVTCRRRVAGPPGTCAASFSPCSRRRFRRRACR